jgi:resuscitation-promoting factor RpfB
MKRFWLILIVALTAACNQATHEATQSVASKPAPVTAVSVPPPTPSQPKPVNVPKVVGQNLSRARSTLHKAGLAVNPQTRESTTPPGTVLSQSPQNGKADPGEPVTIVVAIPLPRIPNVVGKDVKVANRIIDNAGFNVHVKKQGSSAPKDQVLSQSPSAGTASHSGRIVSLTIAKPLPKPPAPSGGSGGARTSGGGGNCAPGYSPCLPQGPSDYDCAGGSGDGPAYTKPGVAYHVSGSDPYGLDADGDGQGCE